MCRNANSPETLESRRRTVRTDTPTWSLATVCSRTAPPVYCAVMNANTSAATTSAGGLPTTVKNTFRSYATAATVLGRDRTPRNSR